MQEILDLQTLESDEIAAGGDDTAPYTDGSGVSYNC